MPDPTSESSARIDLLSTLRALPDPRVERTRLHKFEDILLISICSLLCGAESFEDMELFGDAKESWLRTFLELPHGIPSHDTFNRLFALRRAIAAGQSPKVVVSAWAAGNGLVLGQRRVEDKSNEITAVPELLRSLELAGCIVTLDAMGCQRRIAREIIEADAQYVLALKGNQGTAHEEIQSYLDAAIASADPALAGCEHVEKGHGRIETRRYWQSADIGWFADRGKWEGLRSVGVVESVRDLHGQTSTERRYYLSSLELDVKKFAHAIRSHWGVENQLHWVLDVVFGEDQSRARTGHAAENLATLRRWALNLLKADTRKARHSIKGRIKAAGWDHKYLLHLLALTPNLDA